MDRGSHLLGLLLMAGLGTAAGCGGSGPRAVLKSGADNLVVNIRLRPFPADEPQQVVGVQSVMLYVSPYLLNEPHALGPDGQPISADGRITLVQAYRTC